MEPAELLDERLATTDDMRAAIEGLTDDDTLRLTKAARAFLPGTEYKATNEVINEAVARAMAGCGDKKGRHWPIDRVPFVAFMIMTMRSIADASRESLLMTRTDYLSAMETEGSRAAVLDRLGFQTPSVEQEAIEEEDAAQTLTKAKVDADKIDAFFDSDQEVAWLIMCLKDGKSPSKARASAGLTTTQYETARKRLRRGAEKLFPGRSAQ